MEPVPTLVIPLYHSAEQVAGTNELDQRHSNCAAKSEVALSWRISLSRLARIGIEILTAANCIRETRVTTVPKCELDAEQGGATYVNEDVVIDGQLVTGRGYAENTVVLRDFIRMLKAVRA